MEKENQKSRLYGDPPMRREKRDQSVSSNQSVGSSQQKNRGRYGRQVSRSTQPNQISSNRQTGQKPMTAYHSHGPRQDLTAQAGTPKQGEQRSGERSRGDRGRRGSSRGGPELVKSRHTISTISDSSYNGKVFAPRRAKLKMMSLGGMGVMNKNMMVYEYDDPNLPDGGDIIIVDCGLGFPDAEMYGIDYLIPDITYLKGDRRKKIRGILITHGHEDHIGALPHTLPDLGNVPVFATRLVGGLIEKKLSEYKLLQGFKVSVFDPEETLRLGVFRIEPFRVAHSVPQSVGFGIHTPYGLIIHMADFKIDLTPVDNWYTDLDKIKNLTEKAGGALILALESTYIEEKGHSLSSQVVDEGFNEVFNFARGRIIVAAFASQIARVQQVFNMAVRYGRKVAISGRSMQNNIEVAFNLGFLKAPPDLIVNLNDIKKLPDDRVVIISTGSQAQSRSALMRMSIGEHQQVSIKESDTVVISASPIPGNEDAIYRMMDDLLRMGPRVVHNKQMNIHATGHGFRDEIEMIYKLVRPKYYIPIHGDYHQLIANRDMALSNGMPADRIFVIEDGEVLDIDDQGVKVSKHCVPVGSVMVDGLGVGDIGNIVLRDRQAMAQEGLFVVIATVDRNTGKLLTSPDIISRGFVYMRESNELINGARNEIKKIFADFSQAWSQDWKKDIKEILKEDIGNFLYRNTKRRPMVIPVVIEV